MCKVIPKATGYRGRKGYIQGDKGNTGNGHKGHSCVDVHQVEHIEKAANTCIQLTDEGKK